MVWPGQLSGPPLKELLLPGPTRAVRKAERSLAGQLSGPPLKDCSCRGCDFTDRANRASLAGQLSGPPLKAADTSAVQLGAFWRRFGRAIVRPSIEGHRARLQLGPPYSGHRFGRAIVRPSIEGDLAIGSPSAARTCGVWPGNCPALH